MIEVRVKGGTILCITQIAAAGDGFNLAVLDAPDAVVVPIDDVEIPIRAHGHVLRQIQLSIQRNEPVTIEAGLASACNRRDDRGRTT
jgi:hypothetical protein